MFEKQRRRNRILGRFDISSEMREVEDLHLLGQLSHYFERSRGAVIVKVDEKIIENQR